MRNLKTFLYDATHKPPLLFPLVALYHIAMFLYVVWSDIGDHYLWIQVLWMIGYTISWIFCCDLRKWAAWMYLGLTCLNLLLYFLLKTQFAIDIYVSSMFILDVLFSFFILFFYRRFQ